MMLKPPVKGQYYNGNRGVTIGSYFNSYSPARADYCKSRMHRQYEVRRQSPEYQRHWWRRLVNALT